MLSSSLFQQNESRQDTLKTVTGKRMYQERLQVAREYLKDLAYELGLTQD